MYCVVSCTNFTRSKKPWKLYCKKLTPRHNCVQKSAMNILPTTFYHAPLLLLASVLLLASLFLLIFLLLLVPAVVGSLMLLTSLLLMAYQLLRRTDDISSFGLSIIGTLTSGKSDYRSSDH
jgi:hypothetical protein